MKNFFKKTWGFLSGKKRAIGLLVMGVSKFCGEYEMIIFALGSLIGGTGIAHAIKKRRKVMKILGLIDINWLAKMLFQLASKVVDAIVPGESLSKDQKKAVRIAYYFGKEFGVDYVESTDTDLDDKALEEIIDLCTDTAEEGNFALPTVPPLE